MIILSTGTRKGIGQELAQHFLDAGHTVIGCSRGAASIVHPDYLHFCLSVGDAAAVKAMMRDIRKRYGELNALINTAGMAMMAPFQLTPSSAITELFETNVFGVMTVSREAIKLLSKSSGGAAILNISTVATSWSIPGQSIYAASKAAVEQLTRTLSRELAGANIRVNNVLLPLYRSSMTRVLPPESKQKMIAQQTIQRECSFADLVGPIQFLISGSASFITGESLALGGGR